MQSKPLPWILVISILIVLMCMCSLAMNFVMDSKNATNNPVQVYVKPWEVDDTSWKPVESVKRLPVLQNEIINPVLFTPSERVRQ